MAQLVNIRLTRADASPWGFRLQGGKDFGQPLLIQKVNGGSAAERAGLQVGDALVRVNGVDVQDLRHKDAQDTIVRAGNNIDMSVQRGGASVWKPQVTAVGAVPSPGSNSPLPVTKTSLAAKPSSAQIPSGHNVSPRPFGGASTPQLNGGDVKALVNKQYNSPIGVYSEENIAETLSAQTEVLKTGALGVNFMKNERSYDSQKSEVFKMVQEVEHEPKEPEPETIATNLPTTNFPAVTGLRHVAPPEAKPPAETAPSNPLPPGQNICADCERLIVGVFVRIKEKNLHVECFKCATCGSSLKNVGYYTINNKLYCDIHAKMVARQNPPAPNLDPVTVPPGGRIPSGIVSSPAPPAPFPSSFPSQPPKVARLPSSGPAPAPVSLPVSFPPSLPTVGPQSPQPGTLAPLPFHTPSAPAPKPFGSVSAPAPAPFAPSAPQPNISAPKPQTDNLNPVIWPPIQKKVPVAEREKKVCIIEPEKTETHEKQEVYQGCKTTRQMSICSQEVCKWSEKCQQETGSLSSHNEEIRPTSPLPERELEMIVRQNVVAAAQSHEGSKSKRTTSTSVSKINTAEQICAQSLATQMFLLGSQGLSARPDTPDPLDISSRPHEIKSLLPPACAVRALSPKQTVVFPPNLPEVMMSRSRSPSPCPRKQKSNLKKKADQSGEERTGLPPSFIGLPEVKPTPGPMMGCRVEELEPTKPQPQQIPIVEVTQEPDEEAEEEGSQSGQCEQAAQQYSRVVTEIREVQEETRSSEMESVVQSVQRDEHIKPSTTKPQEKPLEEKLYTKNEVEKIIKEELTKVFLNQEEPPAKERPPELSINDLPKPKYASGGMAEALSTASDRPFTPAPFPKVPELSLRPNEPKEPKKERKVPEKYVPCPQPTEPYFPPMPPPPDAENKDERIARALREVGCRSPMTEALTIAPDRRYSPLPTTAKVDVSKLSQLKAEPARDVPSRVEPTLPIKSVKPPTRIESAFRPTGNGNGSLIPKSTPLVYIPHVQQEKLEIRMEERYGINRQEVARGGKTKQMVAGYEITSTVPEVAEIDESQMIKETKVEYGCAVARNPPPKSAEQIPHRTAPSGLRTDHLLPCYQQFLGDIPTRLNRATSPVPPHQIKAPSMEPRPLPATPNLTNRPKTPSYYTSSRCWNANTGESTKKAKEIICAYNTTAASQEASSKQSKTVSQTSSTTASGKATKITTRTMRNASPLAGKPASVTNSGKQTFKPDIPARSLSPSWKADYVRSVQNLSPITVRLPSPVPPAPLPPKGEKTQTTTANVTVKNKSKTTSAKLPKPTTTTQSSTPKTATGSCGTSQGCGTPPSSGRSTPTHCGTSQGCNTPPPMEQRGTKHCGTSQGCGTPPRCPSPKPGRCPSPRAKPAKADTRNSSNKMIENKENMISSNMISSKQKSQQQFSSMSYMGTTSSSSAFASKLKKDEMAIQRNNLAGILKTATGTKSQTLSTELKRVPFQTSSSNTSWAPYPTNLPLPRDCGVNPSSSGPNAGGAGGLGGGRSSIAGATAPRRGRGVLNAAVPAGGRVPLCGHCNNQIRGPFITALGKIWCPEHFICVNPKCKRPLQDIGFVEEDDGLYCEYCFEQYLAPSCDKCRSKIKGDCLNAIGKHFHPECFKCSYCEKLFGNNPFFLEDGLPYCENDWNELFTTKCFSCGFPIEAGDRWVEALNNNYHSQCFNCTMCKKNLEGQSFFAKGGRPFCKNHAR